MKQIARNATMDDCGALRDCRYLLHDRDTKFTRSFRAIIASGRVEPLALPARSPNLNAYAERWVRSVKEECLSKVILFGERSLRRALSDYVDHFHAERNHQGKGNVLLFPRATDRQREGPVQCGLFGSVLETGGHGQEALLERGADGGDALDVDALVEQPAQQRGDDPAVDRRFRREVTRSAPSWSEARVTPGTAASSVAASTGLWQTMSIARGPPHELLDRALGDDLAEVDDRRQVARLLDLVEQVRGEQHGAALVDQLADQAAELEDAGRVEPVHRLVEDQQLGVGEQAAGDAEALAHAERVGLRPCRRRARRGPRAPAPRRCGRGRRRRGPRR